MSIQSEPSLRRQQDLTKAQLFVTRTQYSSDRGFEVLPFYLQNNATQLTNKPVLFGPNPPFPSQRRPSQKNLHDRLRASRPTLPNNKTATTTRRHFLLQQGDKRLIETVTTLICISFTQSRGILYATSITQPVFLFFHLRSGDPRHSPDAPLLLLLLLLFKLKLSRRDTTTTIKHHPLRPILTYRTSGRTSSPCYLVKATHTADAFKNSFF